MHRETGKYVSILKLEAIRKKTKKLGTPSFESLYCWCYVAPLSDIGDSVALGCWERNECRYGSESLHVKE